MVKKTFESQRLHLPQTQYGFSQSFSNWCCSRVTMGSGCWSVTKPTLQIYNIWKVLILKMYPENKKNYVLMVQYKTWMFYVFRGFTNLVLGGHNVKQNQRLETVNSNYNKKDCPVDSIGHLIRMSISVSDENYQYLRCFFVFVFSKVCSATMRHISFGLLSDVNFQSIPGQ